MSVPQVTWTAYEFGNAIEAFKDLRHSADDFIITNYLDSSSIMMMLIASYGGQLVDYQTLPFAYQLTSPQTLNALEQLSQFVHDGVMAYISPINPTGGSYLVHGERFIMIESGNNIRLSTSRSNATIPMQPVMFPSGEYIPVSYQAGMAYINSESRHIEACYDWITTLAKHAELFSGMPVRRSHLDDPKLTAIYGTDMIDFYTVFGESLNAPNAIHFPSQQGIITTEYEAYVEFTLVYFALDNIMLNDAEVVPEMEQAENNIAMYRQCTSEINVLSTDELNLLVEQGTNSRLRYDLQYVDCLVSVVPELRPSFSYLYDIIAGS